MKKYLLVAFILIGIGTSSFAQISRVLNDTLTKIFQKRAAFHNLKGVSASVAFSDGSIWESSYGNYGSKPLTGDLLYEIGSNTKTMVSATILLLEEEGKLSIDDSLFKYLTPIKNVSYGITIKQLLNHTSGLHDFTRNPDYFKFINSNWNTAISIDSVFEKYLLKPNRPPGGSWEYCNTGYLLLGLLIEKVEGKEFHKVLKEKLFGPLGLKETFLSFHDQHKGIYIGTWQGNTYLPDPSRSFMTSAWAAGAVIATPRNLAQWAYDHYSGKTLSTQSFQKMMQTIRISVNEYYGLGVIERTYSGHKYLGHGGKTLQTSTMEYSLDGDYGIVVMNISEGGSGETSDIQNKLEDVLEIELPKVDLTTTKEFDSRPQTYSVYPIPAFSYINLESSENSKFTAQLLSIEGKVLEMKESENGAIRINRANLPAGYYTLKIENETDEVVYKKVVFQ